MLTTATLMSAIAATPEGGTLPLDGPMPTDGYLIAVPLLGTHVQPWNWSDDWGTVYFDDRGRLAVLIEILSSGGGDNTRAIHYVGWWTDPDSSRTLVEPSLHVRTLPDALTVGRILGQRYIYSIAESDVVPVT
jgi:hypothetical protein